MSTDRLQALCKSVQNSHKGGRVAAQMNGEAAHDPSQALEIAYGYATSRHQELVQGLDILHGAGDVSTLLTSALPRTRIKRSERANHWFEEGDDLLYDLIDTKRTFTLLGFNLQVKPRSPSEEDIEAKEMAEQQSHANEFAIATQFSQVIYDLLTAWFTVDSMILSWKVNDSVPINQPDNIDSVPRKIQSAIPGLEYIGTIDPADVDWHNSLGTNRLFVKVPKALECLIRDALTKYGAQKTKAIEELLNSGIPRKWIDAVINMNTRPINSELEGPIVELKNEDGEYWIIKTKAKKNYGLAKPSMYTIFLALECRRMFNDGEFGAAFLLKHFIQHIKLGESITQGEHAGSTKLWAKKADTDDILAKFANSQKTMRMATNHTVKIEWLYPPVEMFSGDKYVNCERRIFRWSGVSISVIGGGEESTAEVFISIKRMIADMWLGRTRTSEIILEFFRHPTIFARSKIPEKLDVVGQYDENVLKDPRQLLEEVRFLVESGIGDPETTMRELGRDPESIRLSKLRSIKRNGATRIYEPVWNRLASGDLQAQDGRDGGKDGGKPKKPETNSTEETRLQTKTSRDSAEKQ